MRASLYFEIPVPSTKDGEFFERGRTFEVFVEDVPARFMVGDCIFLQDFVDKQNHSAEEYDFLETEFVVDAIYWHKDSLGIYPEFNCVALNT